jgi:uncharacterized protein (DUF1330 family)
VSAYVIFDVEIRDAVRYQDFMDQVKTALLAAGGRYLARGGPHTVYEGDWAPRRIVLLEFPSVSAFEAFYHGSTYQSLKAIRDECSSARLVAVEGLD